MNRLPHREECCGRGDWIWVRNATNRLSGGRREALCGAVKPFEWDDWWGPRASACRYIYEVAYFERSVMKTTGTDKKFETPMLAAWEAKRREESASVRAASLIADKTELRGRDSLAPHVPIPGPAMLALLRTHEELIAAFLSRFLGHLSEPLTSLS